MKSASYRRCEVCDRHVDPATGTCPTPGACDLLRSPHRRRKSADKAVADATHLAIRESTTGFPSAAEVGPGAAAVSALEQKRRLVAQARARRGWLHGNHRDRRSG